MKNCWWEGKDFHIETVDNRHFVFKNAFFSDYESRRENNDAVLTQKCDSRV